MNNRILRKVIICATCTLSLGLSVEAGAQESISIGGVELNLGMSKDVVLRKISETGLGPRKIHDADGCELWTSSTQESEQKKGESQDKRLWTLEFCGDILCYVSIYQSDEKRMNLAAAAPFAESMIDALANLEAENKVCTIKTSSSSHGSSAEISCGQLHVTVSVDTPSGYKFAMVTEELGEMVLPKAKK